MTESDVYEVAKIAAFSYCKRFSSFEQYDDALSEATLFLLDKKSIWAKPRSTIVTRVVGALVRNYQNYHGLRLKNKPFFYFGEFDLDNVAKETPLVDRRQLDEWNNIIENALKQREFEQYDDLIRDIISGLSIVAVTEKYHLPQRRVRSVFKRFKTACRRQF